MPRLGDRLHVEPLARVVLHGAETDDGDRVALVCNDAQDVLGSNRVLAFAREDGEERRRGVVVQRDVGCEGVLRRGEGAGQDETFSKERGWTTHGVRGEGLALVQDLVALRSRAVE